MLVAAIVAWPAVGALAQTAGTWSQSQGGPTHAGYAPAAPAPPFRQAWYLEAATGGPASSFGLSAPVVSGSTVIAVGPEAVVAADLVTGRELWSVARAYGPSVPPAIATRKRAAILLYTEGFGDSLPGTSAPPSPGSGASPSSSSTGGARPIDSRLMAIDLATQETLWKAPVQLKEVSRTGVTVDGNTAYVGDNRGNVYAVDVASGSLRWTARTGGFLTAPLAASGGLVVATLQASRTVRPRVVALNGSDGSRAWTTEVDGGGVFATPPAIDGERVVAGFSDQTVRAFGLADGVERWATRMNGPIFFTGAPAVTPDAIVVVDSLGEVYRFDPATGSRVWDFALNEPVLRSPAVVAGTRVLVATAKGQLVAIDLTSGRLVWRSEPSGAVLRTFALAPDAVVAVRGGVRSGLIGYVNDPSGTLVSVVSPTVLDLPSLLGAFLAAAVPIGLLLLLGGRALRARMGPAFLDEAEADAEDVRGRPGSDDEEDA